MKKLFWVLSAALILISSATMADIQITFMRDEQGKLVVGHSWGVYTHVGPDQHLVFCSPKNKFCSIESVDNAGVDRQRRCVHHVGLSQGEPKLETVNGVYGYYIAFGMNKQIFCTAANYYCGTPSAPGCFYGL